MVIAGAAGCSGDFGLGSGYWLHFTCTGIVRYQERPRWGELTTFPSDCPTHFEVWLPRETVLPEGPELIEIYPEDGDVPLIVPGALTRDLVSLEPDGDRWHYDGLTHDLAGLPDGLYRLVHRRSAIPEGLEPTLPVVDAMDWVPFQDEDALVTRFRLGVEPSGDDAGVPDGG